RFDGKDVQGCREGAEHARRGGDAYAGHQPHVARCQRRAERNLAPRTRCADGNAAVAGGGRGRIAGGNSRLAVALGEGSRACEIGTYTVWCRTASRRERWPSSRQNVRARQRVHSQGKNPRTVTSRSCAQPLRFSRRRWLEPQCLQTLLLNRLTSSYDWHPTKGCCFGWPHARWKRPKITEDCAGGEPGLMPRLVLIRRILLALKRAALSHQGSALSQKGCSGRSGRVNPSGTGHLPSAEGVTFFTPSRSLSILAH